MLPAKSEAVLDQAERAVKEIGIPPCPAMLARLVREVRADEPDFGVIDEIVGGDVGIAAALLKTVNSPFYGLSDPATSVRQALALLGTRAVAQLVTGLLLRQAFPASGARLESFWETSSRVAVLSAQIARQTGAGDLDSAHTFGLFRDAGRALFLRRYADYPALEASAMAASRRVVDAEYERYGMNHARVGSLLAASWLLPQAVCDAVLHHHNPDALAGRARGLEASTCRLIAVGALAEQAHWWQLGDRSPAEVHFAARLAGAQLDLDEGALRALSGAIAATQLAA